MVAGYCRKRLVRGEKGACGLGFDLVELRRRLKRKTRLINKIREFWKNKKYVRQKEFMEKVGLLARARQGGDMLLHVDLWTLGGKGCGLLL